MAGKYNLEKLSLFDLHMKKVDAGLTASEINGRWCSRCFLHLRALSILVPIHKFLYEINKLTKALDFCFGVIYSYIASCTSSTELIMTVASYRNYRKTQQTSWLNV